jgi:hypothetical protein
MTVEFTALHRHKKGHTYDPWSRSISSTDMGAIVSSSFSHTESVGRIGEVSSPAAQANAVRAPMPTENLIIVEGRYHPYPGQSDPNVNWVQSGPNSPQLTRTENTNTPRAAFAVAPVPAEPIPYTPPRGYPPVSKLPDGF